MITTHKEALDCIEWYVDLLDKIVQRRPAFGFAEAKAGYEAAMEFLKEA